MAGCSVPVEYAGLCPTFHSHVKLYICEILDLKQHSVLADAYLYRNHIVNKVDVVGIVVRVDQRAKAVIYSVDDGTGVIDCCCWRESGTPNQSVPKGLPSALVNKLKQIQEIVEETERGYDLGDLIQVRGKVKIFRDTKEISAYYHNKLTDPNAETARMLELPALHREVYDQSPELPGDIQTALQSGTAQQQLQEERLLHDMKKLLLQKLACFPGASLDEDSVINFIKDSYKIDENTKDLTSLLNKVCESLINDGCFYPSTLSSDVYMRTKQDTRLLSQVLDILKSECTKQKYSMQGCHHLRILTHLNQHEEYKRLTERAVLVALETLEETSDVISVSENHYLPVT